MPDDLVEKLFSLFTSADRAAAMTGDLAEEREDRGRLWFWLHVAGRLPQDREKWFEALAERGRVAELSGTHDLIVSSRPEVLAQIQAFVTSLPAK